MNDEIKEILKEIECYRNEELCLIFLSRKESNALLDYITNLQQRSVDIGEYNTLVNEYNEIYKENERLKENNQAMQEEMARVWEENEDNLKCIKSLKEQLESVINENQRLLKQWFEDNDKTVKLVSEKECYKSNYNDYKSRCEKINEILKESPDFNYSNDYIILKRRIESVLQNEDDNK